MEVLCRLAGVRAGLRRITRLLSPTLSSNFVGREGEEAHAYRTSYGLAAGFPNFAFLILNF
jgi:hypothetical protein